MVLSIALEIHKTTKFMIAKFREFIMKEGNQIIKNEELVGGKPKPPAQAGGKPIPNNGDPIKFTLELLSLKTRCDTFINKSFSEDMLF